MWERGGRACMVADERTQDDSASGWVRGFGVATSNTNLRTRYSHSTNGCNHYLLVDSWSLSDLGGIGALRCWRDRGLDCPKQDHLYWLNMVDTQGRYVSVGLAAEQE